MRAVSETSSGGDGTGGGSGITPIVGLDTVTIQDSEDVAEQARVSAAESARKLADSGAQNVARDVAQKLPEMIHACWFLLYRSYVRRKSEQAAQIAVVKAKASQVEKKKRTREGEESTVESTVEKNQRTRQERMGALKEEREDADDSRTAAASKGLHVSFEVINEMEEAGIKVHGLCYRSLMEICGHSKLADTAKLVFGDMVGKKVILDTISYNAFVQAIVQDEDEFATTKKFNLFRPYRCLPDQTDVAAKGDAAGSKGNRVELRLCTEDGMQIGAQDEAVALAVWGIGASSYDDLLCLPALYITVSGGEGAAGQQKRYSFVSPFTLTAELEGLLAHWGDSLATVVSLETQLLRLREEHPTVRTITRSHPLTGTATTLPRSATTFQQSSHVRGLLNLWLVALRAGVLVLRVVLPPLRFTVCIPARGRSRLPAPGRKGRWSQQAEGHARPEEHAAGGAAKRVRVRGVFVCGAGGGEWRAAVQCGAGGRGYAQQQLGVAAAGTGGGGGGGGRRARADVDRHCRRGRGSTRGSGTRAGGRRR